jgi:hypothetical protein
VNRDAPRGETRSLAFGMDQPDRIVEAVLHLDDA